MRFLTYSLAKCTLKIDLKRFSYPHRIYENSYLFNKKPLSVLVKHFQNYREFLNFKAFQKPLLESNIYLKINTILKLTKNNFWNLKHNSNLSRKYKISLF